MSEKEKKATEEEQEKDGITYPDDEDLENEEISEEEEEETPEGDKEVEPKPEEAEETPRFELKKPEVETPSAEGTDDGITEIIHNGQAYRLTKDKIIELAQKGFDYDFKVGPHGKLVQMIEADPEIATLVSDHWQRKVTGEPSKKPTEDQQPFSVKPIAEYENEAEWLQDNIQRAIDFGTSQATPAIPAAPAVQPAEAPPVRDTAVADALKMRDPENFHKVLPQMSEYVAQLSVADYQRVNSDMAALCQFYDFVKERVTKKSIASASVPANPSKPGFKVRSGGGEAPKAEGAVGAAWKLSKDDFQKQLDKIKGFS